LERGEIRRIWKGEMAWEKGIWGNGVENLGKRGAVQKVLTRISVYAARYHNKVNIYAVNETAGCAFTLLPHPGPSDGADGTLRGSPA
jgi:hypothetical protein